MLVTLQFDIIAPDTELARESLTYVRMEKDIILPLAPFPGLRIFLPALILENDPRVPDLRKLNEIACVKTGAFDICKITCHLGDYPKIEVYSEGVVVNTLEQFKATVEIYRIEYGFHES